MKKYFLDLFEYNNWANDKIIHRLHEVEIDFTNPSPLKILSHVVASQDAWLERVNNRKSYNIFLWEEYSLQEIEVLSLNSHKGWLRFISKLDENDFNKMCEYKNSGGIRNSKTYQDIFQHVINHSTYHRGQINLTFRMNSIEPLKLDFIYYC